MFFSIFYYTQIVDERKSIFREEFQIKNVEEMVELNQNITNKHKKLLWNNGSSNIIKEK